MFYKKRASIVVISLLLLGAIFTLGLSNNSLIENENLNPQSSLFKYPVTAGGVGWVAGNSLGDGYGIILHTTDGGSRWERQGSEGEIPDVDLATVSAVDVCNAWVVGGVSDGYGVILRTQDGGKSWTRQGDKDQIPEVGILAIHAVNNSIAWAAGGDVILLTKDGGATWNKQAQGLATGYGLFGVYASDANHVWVVGGCGDQSCQDEPGIILRSKNGGKTWKRTYHQKGELGGYLISVHGLDSKTVWTVGNDTVLHTTDGGKTWQDKTPAEGGGFYDWNGVFAVDNENIWFARDNDGIFKYDGSKWHTYPMPSDSGNEFYHLLRVSAIDPEKVWIVGFSPPNSGNIIHTETGDENWITQDPGLDTGFWGVSFVKPGICNPQNYYLPLAAVE